MDKRKRMRILGVPVDMVTCESALSIFRELLSRQGCSLIVTPNSEIVVNAGKDPGLFQVLEEADLVIPDGIGLVYASRILKNPLKERVTGIDFLTQILGYLQETGQSVFLFGGKPGVAEKAAENMQKTFPKLRIAGTRHGYFTEEEEPFIAEEINESEASFLCAALGSPKQELFMKKYASRFSSVRAGMGVGGSLDVWAGTAKRAPAFYQRHGLEWLYRFAKQPSRAGRMLKLPVFMIKVLISNKQHDNWEEKTGMKELEKIAVSIRVGIIKAVAAAGSGHPGGSLSAADLVTALYFKEMNLDPRNPGDANRDKFILSKGHAGPAQYAALAEKGFFPKEELKTLRKLGSKLQGHPDMKKVPGVEMSTGSLGQGFAVAGGMAMANKLDKSSGRIYTLLGDGELQEGLVWEAAMSAAHYGLDNLVAIVDWNGLQIDGSNDDVMKVTPIHEKFAAFGWNAIMIDGHDFEEILDALEKARSCKGKPTAIIAKTIKGKGVSFMENDGGWHGKAPTEEEARKAIGELGGEW